MYREPEVKSARFSRGVVISTGEAPAELTASEAEEAAAFVAGVVDEAAAAGAVEAKRAPAPFRIKRFVLEN